MRNKIIASLLTTTFASVVSAQVLYWQVNPNVTIEKAAEGTSWNFATLYAVSGDGTTTATVLKSSKFNGNGTSSTANQYVDKAYFSSSDNLPAYANLGETSYTSYSFYIELINYSDGAATSVARSTTVAYGALGTALQSAAEFNASWSSINAMGTGLTFTAIPEPTSGLMLLVGAAILGLRRKRQQI